MLGSSVLLPAVEFEYDQGRRSESLVGNLNAQTSLGGEQAMSDLEAQVAQLRRANRRWKVLALSACCVLGLICAFWYLNATVERDRAQRAQARVIQAMRDASALR